MNINIRYEIDGRRVEPRQLKDALQASILKGLADEVKKKLRSCRCPDHDQDGSIKLVQKREKLTLEAEACCQKMNDEMARRLK